MGLVVQPTKIGSSVLLESRFVESGKLVMVSFSSTVVVCMTSPLCQNLTVKLSALQ